MLLWWGLAAWAAGGVGETMTWDIHYTGISAATARASTTAGPGGTLAIDTWIKNADWYGSLYTIDDHTRSLWTPGGGSTRHETRYREGGFRQDQDMRLQPEGFTVWRRQFFREDDEWREWTTPYDPHPYVEDPITAIYAIRELDGAGPWRFPVFSGSATWPLDVKTTERTQLTGTPLGDVDVIVYSLQTRHRGEWEQHGRFLVYLTDDERRIPVKIVIKSSIGAIRADLSGYTPPNGSTP